MNLVPVQSGIYLDAPAASAWLGIEAAARTRYRVDLNITVPYGGYRSPAMEREMWADRFNKSKYPNGVAAPGSSVHRFGRSFDINNWGALGSTRLDALAREFGAVRAIPGERWHYEYRGGGASDALPPATVAGGDPYQRILRSIKKGKTTMDYMLLGNLDTGAVCFIIFGGEGYIFGSEQEYKDLRATITAYNGMPTTPADKKIREMPELSHQNVLFVKNSLWTVTVKAFCI